MKSTQWLQKLNMKTPIHNQKNSYNLEQKQSKDLNW